MPRQTITNDRATWINVTDETPEDLQYLRSAFHISDEDVALLEKENQRTRIEHKEEYTVMALRFPVYNRATRELYPTEVSIFLYNNHIVTVHDNSIPQINDFFTRLEKEPAFQKTVFDRGSESVLYYILHDLLSYCFPMLDHITIDTHTIEKSIFAGEEREMTKEILVARRNITDFRETIYHHKDILKKFLTSAQLNEKSTKRETTEYFSDLIEMTKEIWSLLERQKETIEALQQTNDNLISFKINDVITVLTMFSAVLLPISVIFGLFSVNTSIPLLPSAPYDFIIVVMIGVVLGSGMVFYFKKKKWM